MPDDAITNSGGQSVRPNSSTAHSSRILSFEEARRVVEGQAFGLALPTTESVELLGAGGRVLAEGIVADRDFPPFARATRDGWSLKRSASGVV